MTFRPAFICILLSLAACHQRRCHIPEEFLAETAQLRGLPFTKPVECRWASKSEVRALLKESLLKKISEQQLELEGKLYELIGVVPEGYPYVERMLDAYADRLLAFYSPELKFFVIVAKQNTQELEAVIIHELTHVLQDQHFDAEHLLDERFDNDLLLARTAVLEGDANRVMHAHMKTSICADATEDEIIRGLKQRLANSHNVPHALELIMSFPYPFGERFLCELERRNGKESVQNLFEKLPTSTLELIDLERYFSAPRPQNKPEMLSLNGALVRERLGAFTTAAMLANYLPFERAYATGKLWRDDAAELREADGNYKLTWQITAEDPEAARTIEATIRDAYRVRFVAGGIERVTIKREGNQVLVALTLPMAR